MAARALAGALTLLALGAGCGRPEPKAHARAAPSARALTPPASAAAAPPPRPLGAPSSAALPSASPRPEQPGAELTWIYPHTSYGLLHVVVTVPAHHVGERLPVLVAFHGKGEALKGPARGARGWVEDYALPRALQRLAAPPLTDADLEHLSTPARLAQLNAALAARPFGGVIVVTPYTPNILAGSRSLEAAAPMARWLVDELLPRVVRETPALAEPSATGVDGVSLGGRMALLVGLAAPERFGTVGVLQPAFDSFDASELARRAARAVARNPRLEFRLLTTHDDYFLVATRSIARAFESAQVPVDLVVLPGPHDYAFNRGPGVYEMLLLHDRSLRGWPTLPPPAP